MRSYFIVAFTDAAPLDFFHHDLRSLQTDSGTVRYMRCDEVSSTALGLIRLVPELDKQEGTLELYVPGSYVLWMIRSTRAAELGFA